MNTFVNRLLPSMMLVLCLAACTSEQRITPQQFHPFSHDYEDPRCPESPLMIDGEPASGVVVVERGEGKYARRLAQTTFNQGYPDGSLQTWYENGDKRIEVEHWERRETGDSADQCLFRGHLTVWKPGGALFRELNFDHLGNLISGTEWCPGGKLKKSEKTDAGRTQQTFDCATGNPTLKVTQVGDDPDHLLKETWYPNGKPESSGAFSGVLPVGEHRKWYENGAKKFQGSFVNGRPSGPHTAWSEEGDVLEQGEYRTTPRSDSSWDDGKTEDTLKAGGPMGGLAILGTSFNNHYKAGVWIESTGINCHSATGWLALVSIDCRSNTNSRKSIKRHYGGEGFIGEDYLPIYVKALAPAYGTPNPGTVEMLLSEGKVAISNALPLETLFVSGNQGVSTSAIFPVDRWTYSVVAAADANLDVLIARGADINATDSMGRTRLIYCAAAAPERVCRPTVGSLGAAISKGADVAVADSTGMTALHYLTTRRADRRTPLLDAAELLLNAGAKVNAKTVEGRTPLMLALRYRNQKLAEWLLDHGADANAADAEGRRPIHYLVLTQDDRYSIGESAYFLTMVARLHEMNADIDAPMDWDGQQLSIRDLAIQNGLSGLVHTIDTLKSGTP